MYWILIIGLVFVFLKMQGQKNQISALSERVKGLEEKLGLSDSPAQAQNVDPKLAASTIVEPKVSQKPKAKKVEFKPIVLPLNPKANDAPPKPPREAVVFTAQNQAKLLKWFAENWAYALGALSLALAGIYIVRLGMEHGYFPPIFRVLGGAAFGASLIASADWLRTKGGDEKGSVTEYVPSTVASAGFATLFASVLGAHTLYGLIGASTSFVGLALVAAFAIVAGWRFGALLSALGVAGAFLAPLMVGEASETSYLMFAYALLVLAMTLAVDTVKRTGWLSAWAMVASFGFSFLIYSGQIVTTNSDIYGVSYLGFALAFLALVAIIPERKLTPQMGKGGIISQQFLKAGWPSFPARLVGGAMLANVAIFAIVFAAWPQGFWTIMVYVSLLAVMCFFWLSQSDALEEYALVPLGMTLFLLLMRVGDYDGSDFEHLLSISLLGLVLALMCALSAQLFKQLNNLWRYVSIGYPFMFATLLVMNWSMGVAMPYWQLIVGAYAGLTAFLAFHYSTKLGKDSAVVDIAVVAIWGYVAMIAWSYLQDLPLVIALALIVVPLTFGALKMNWRFHEIATKIWTGFAVFIAFSETLFGSWIELGVLMALTAGAIALYLQCKEARPKLRIHFEAWGFVLASVSAATLLFLTLDAMGINSIFSELGMLILLVMAQVVGIRHRLSIKDGAAMFRKVLLGLYLCFGGLLVVALIVALPLLEGFLSERILGMPLINDMLIGYLAPALALIAIHRYQPWLRMRIDYVGYTICALWVIMVVRHFWQGSGLIGMGRPTGSGELYSYTVMMLLTMTATMYKAVTQGNQIWRRVSYIIILLTSVKIYFIDLAQFEGILRVVALLIFGVILIGFNFIDRKLISSSK